MSTAVLVLIQVLLVIALSRLMGQVCRAIKQPLDLSEILSEEQKSGRKEF
jgi:hypothetical protein